MIIHYFPEEKHYGALLLNPATNDGIFNKDKKTSRISLSSAGGPPLYITDDPRVTRSSKYHTCEIEETVWEKLKGLLDTEDTQATRRIMSEMEGIASGSPLFFLRSDDLVEREETMCAA